MLVIIYLQKPMYINFYLYDSFFLFIQIVLSRSSVDLIKTDKILIFLWVRPRKKKRYFTHKIISFSNFQLSWVRMRIFPDNKNRKNKHQIIEEDGRKPQLFLLLCPVYVLFLFLLFQQIHFFQVSLHNTELFLAYVRMGMCWVCVCVCVYFLMVFVVNVKCLVIQCVMVISTTMALRSITTNPKTT